MSLVAGRANNCNNNSAGGVIRIAVANRLDVTGATVAVDKSITAVTMAASKVAFLYSFHDQTAKFTEAGVFQNNSESFTSKIEGNWMGWSQADRTALVALYKASPCGLVVFAQLENGEVIVIGLHPDYPTVTDRYFMKMEGNDFDSGAAFTDPMQNIVRLMCSSTTPATKFTPGWAGVPL